MTTLLVVVIFAVAVLGLLVAGLLRSHAEILRTLHDMGYGENRQTSRIELKTRDGVAAPRPNATPARDVMGSTPTGTAMKVGVVNTDHTTLLAFLTTGCTTCRGFWEAFADRDLELPGDQTRLVIVTKGLDQESESLLRELAPSHVPTVATTQAWEDYEVPVSPYFILVDGPSGTTLGEGAAGSWRQVASLLKQAVADAGLTTNPRRHGSTGREREQRADDELAAAGIHPGDPSLYPDPNTVEERDDT